ncbi:MAG TPA: chromosome segregation protein SMC [Kiritimatiellia bacterium]|nr:chromosome segregation protein SMC [Kiritimatiellia bacterium]
MYLKRLEIVGFKSFADKTRLEFEPGMTAIVGPNGCGKSNVADSIRWVLGEQSAKALRGGKMEDVIFSGTDTQKPHGMAEVSMTLADCEATLGLDYNEVTITRRVFRSGDGQYFINKAPCRLKDIHRLFMDTGIGTNSYSIMEQGKIDRILSSRPEDRRAVFEEASGITKYKADRKEALRKLEQTEANLLRLDDIIREVKRQIISLQRQAGKARRYQTMREQLQAYEVYGARLRVHDLDQALHTLQTRIASILEQDQTIRTGIAEAEEATTARRAELTAAEEDMAREMEEAVRLRTDLDRVRELIRTNHERIAELEHLSARDSRDADDARIRLDQHQTSRAEEAQRLAAAHQERDHADHALTAQVALLSEQDKAVADINRLLHQLRSEQVELDTRLAQQQNELAKIDAEERQNDLRLERLAAEQTETLRVVETLTARGNDMAATLATLVQAVETETARLEEAQRLRRDKAGAIAELKQLLADLKPKAAGKKAQIDLIDRSRDQQEGFPEGARRILKKDPALVTDPSAIIGPLADALHAEPDYQIALQAVLRPWLDALILRNEDDLRSLLNALDANQAGSARLVQADLPAPAASAPGGNRLLDHVRVEPACRNLLETLIGQVLVVEGPADLPRPLPPGSTFVTQTGLVLGHGTAERWSADGAATNPLARRQLRDSLARELDELNRHIDTHEQRLADLAREESTVETHIEDARRKLEEARRNHASAEGEHRVLLRQKKEAEQRVETVTYELNSLAERKSGGGDRRHAIAARMQEIRDRQGEIRATLGAKTEELRDHDQKRNTLQAAVTELRVTFSERRQTAEYLAHRIDQLDSRLRELSTLIEERSRGVDTYRERIEGLRTGIQTAEQRIPPLETETADLARRIDERKAAKDALLAELATTEQRLRDHRNQHEELNQKRSQAEVELAQQQIRRQNLVDRITGEYRITLEDIERCPEPQWENGEKLPREALDNFVAELRAKIEAIGPVNLVAIEEHAELEERYAFLTAQNSDLINAKQQLIEMIKEINKTTTDLFSTTFNQVNENFQKMFEQIFGGGTAKLVLTDEGDILESGIEIIARPPGKKLQTVSLLSGGERTMTAVALLFALYMVKPSPFCVLDELDAALDDANIGRFVRTVQGFLGDSQFIVITHNRQTIAAAGTLYGVTMEKQGISKIVSVKFSEAVEADKTTA